MKMHGQLIGVILALSFVTSSCGSDECKSFSNEVPTELPPNLKTQLHGLLTYNKWVLANEDGDTIIYEANGPYLDEIYIEQPGKDPVCNRQYRGSREFIIRYKHHKGDMNESPASLDAYSTSANLLQVRHDFGDIEWNVSSDAISSSSRTLTVFQDSVVFQNTTYYDVFYDPRRSFLIYNNAAIGKISIQDGISPSFYLVYYE